MALALTPYSCEMYNDPSIANLPCRIEVKLIRVRSRSGWKEAPIKGGVEAERVGNRFRFRFR